MAAADGGDTSGEDLAASGALGRGSPGNTGASEAPAGSRRRGRQPEVMEIVDELAQETKRTTLLERAEQQLKVKQNTVSRVFFAFGMTDDKKIQAAIEQEFLKWKDGQEKQSPAALSGILFFLGQCALHFLEGPTELLFGALELFHSLSQEVKPGPGVAASSARTALINPIRILHFSELHGVRVSTSWCACLSGGKSTGTQGTLDDSNSSELVFGAYSKFIKMCLKVRESQSGEEEDMHRLQATYKRHTDMVPTVDEVNLFLSKSGADYFFNFPEFEKVFIAPFHLVLHSELLWPMPPALPY